MKPIEKTPRHSQLQPPREALDGPKADLCCPPRRMRPCVRVAASWVLFVSGSACTQHFQVAYSLMPNPTQLRTAHPSSADIVVQDDRAEGNTVGTARALTFVSDTDLAELLQQSLGLEAVDRGLTLTKGGLTVVARLLRTELKIGAALPMTQLTELASDSSGALGLGENASPRLLLDGQLDSFSRFDWLVQAQAEVSFRVTVSPGSGKPNSFDSVVSGSCLWFDFDPNEKAVGGAFEYALRDAMAKLFADGAFLVALLGTERTQMPLTHGPLPKETFFVVDGPWRNPDHLAMCRQVVKDLHWEWNHRAPVQATLGIYPSHRQLSVMLQGELIQTLILSKDDEVETLCRHAVQVISAVALDPEGTRTRVRSLALKPGTETSPPTKAQLEGALKLRPDLLNQCRDGEMKAARDIEVVATIWPSGETTRLEVVDGSASTEFAACVGRLTRHLRFGEYYGHIEQVRSQIHLESL